MKKEIVSLGNRDYLVLSSDGKTYYGVNLNRLDVGLKPCDCISTKFQCRHLDKVILHNSIR